MSTPIVGADLFRTVMDGAGGRCWCTGQCGQSHRKTEGRCLKRHGQGRVRLIAAPADPTVTERAAMGLPVSGLRAWCPTCHTGACRAVQRTAAAAPEPDQYGLFDL
ncbi:hypothetical protein OG896_29505 [Streptomyces sp. NBC_00669]|uniref:hypothetical protein n=1 Tax=Streptomyces sp. NBC_00669 TaxID=2976011 RepID=UPI002E30D4CD|nr:hypothetical protein [Streptomyces sp. NBC_00669]